MFTLFDKSDFIIFEAFANQIIILVSQPGLK